MAAHVAAASAVLDGQPSSLRRRTRQCASQLSLVTAEVAELASLLDDVDALSSRVDAVEARRARATRGVRQRVQRTHAKRLASIEGREGAIARAVVAESVSALSSTLSAEQHATASGATYGSLSDRADAAIAADRFAWVKSTSTRIYLIWGGMCLWLVVSLAAVAPELCSRLGLPTVDGLGTRRRQEPATAGMDSGSGHQSSGRAPHQGAPRTALSSNTAPQRA